MSVVVTAVLSSCVNLKAVYPSFYEEQSYRKMAVVADGTVLQDTRGLRDIMLADQSMKAARLLQSQVNSELRAKGYQSSPSITCTGAGGPKDRKLFASNDPTATDGPELTGVYQIVRHGRTTGNQSYAVDRLFERLHSLTLDNHAVKKVDFPEIDLLGIPEGQYVVLVSGLARNVNLSKQLAQGVAMGIVTLGQGVAFQQDVAEIRIAIIDSRTRRLVWRHQIKGEVRNEQEARAEISKLLEQFPVYRGASSGSLRR